MGELAPPPAIEAGPTPGSLPSDVIVGELMDAASPAAPDTSPKGSENVVDAEVLGEQPTTPAPTYPMEDMSNHEYWGDHARATYMGAPSRPDADLGSSSVIYSDTSAMGSSVHVSARVGRPVGQEQPVPQPSETAGNEPKTTELQLRKAYNRDIAGLLGLTGKAAERFDVANKALHLRNLSAAAAERLRDWVDGVAQMPGGRVRLPTLQEFRDMEDGRIRSAAEVGMTVKDPTLEELAARETKWREQWGELANAGPRGRRLRVADALRGLGLHNR